MPDATAEVIEIFDRLEAVLASHVPPFTVRAGGIASKRDYQLWSERPVEIDGRKRDEVYFAGLVAQKGYVGFYFMPVYTHADRTRLFAPDLLALLEGKSCFHVKRLDDVLEQHVENALAEGVALYRERGWVD